MKPQSGQFDSVAGFDNGTVRLDKQGLAMKPGQDWASPWPVGHPNRTEWVSPEQETANSRKAAPSTPEYRTEYDKSSKTFLTPKASQEKNGWVSPWPAGHANRTEYVSPEQQTKNMTGA